jgi:S-(hydroxymethyl)glutathione dehydrogenase/alcohol dehydrogenase
MKIRAAVLEAFGAPLVVQEVDLAAPGAGEVLVRLEACGVCHTDLYTASGADPSGYAPTVLGHEGAGIVEAVGDGVDSVAVGDRVLTLFSPQCRECIHCLSDKTNICLAIREQQGQGYLPDGTTRLSLGGEPIRHFMGTSAFAEATVLPEIAVAKVDSAAPADVVCTLACGATTGIGAALYIARVERGSTCVVFGAGLVGLGAVAGCRIAGAERIVCVDLSEERLAIARAQGATDTFVGGDDAVAGRGELLEVVPRYLITGRRIAGASFGGAKGRDRVPELARAYLDGELDLEALISARLPLDEVNEAFAAMERQEGIRSVLTFD